MGVRTGERRLGRSDTPGSAGHMLNKTASSAGHGESHVFDTDGRLHMIPVPQAVRNRKGTLKQGWADSEHAAFMAELLSGALWGPRIHSLQVFFLFALLGLHRAPASQARNHLPRLQKPKSFLG